MTNGSRPTVTIAESERDWDAYVRSRADATVDHLWAWRRIIAEGYGQRPLYLVATRNSQVVGVLPAFIVESRLFGKSVSSLPYHWVAGPLSDSPLVDEELVRALESYAKEDGASFVSLRSHRELTGSIVADTSKVTYRLSIDADEQTLFRSFRKQNRTRVRKGQHAGIRTEFGHARVEEFYDLYCTTMRDLGTPVNTKAIFTKTLDRFGEDANCAVAILDRRPVAAKLFVDAHRRRHFIWGAHDRRFAALSPNYCLLWSCVQEAMSRGLQSIDLGRSSVGSPHALTKAQWGATPAPLYYYRKALKNRAAVSDRGEGGRKLALAIRAWRRLPVALTRLLGPPLARHIP